MTTPSNLIVFQSDNHNRDLLGCYGHPIVKTPNLDRLARERNARDEEQAEKYKSFSFHYHGANLTNMGAHGKNRGW